VEHEARAYPINHEAKLQQQFVRMRVKYAGLYLRESGWQRVGGGGGGRGGICSDVRM
jgi:hypothetical protein